MKHLLLLFSMCLVFYGCSSESSSNNNVPIAAIQSIQPSAKSQEIVLQFTQLAGMGSQGNVEPYYNFRISDKDDFAASTYLGSHQQQLDVTGMAFLKFTIKPKKTDADNETGLNEKVFEYPIVDGQDYYIWINACFAGYGCGEYTKTVARPIPLPKVLNIEDVEITPGDGTLTVKVKNMGEYDEFGVFTGNVCTLADGWKYVPQMVTSDDHYVVTGLNNGEAYPVCVRSQNINTTSGKVASWVFYDGTNVKTIRNGAIVDNKTDENPVPRTPVASTVKPAAPSISVESESNKMVTIKWTGNFTGESAVNNYKVSYSEDGKTYSTPEPVLLSSNNITYNVFGLENGKKYSIKLTAENGAGATDSNIVEGTPKETVIDFNNLDSVLGKAAGTFIYAEDVPHSDFWRISSLYPQGGRTNTDRLTWGKETAIGNMYADSFMWYAKNVLNRNDVDFAFLVGEMITNGIDSYRNITPRFLMALTNINYINDTLVIAHVKGEYLINEAVDYDIDLNDYPALEGEGSVAGKTVFGQAAAIYRSGHYGAGHTGAAAYKQKGWLSPSNEVRYTIEYLPYDLKEFENRFNSKCANVGPDYDSANDPMGCYDKNILINPNLPYSGMYTGSMNATSGIDENVKWGYKRGRIKKGSLTINGQPIDPEKVYKVVTTKKIADTLYVGLLYADKIEDTGALYWQVVGRYIADLGSIDPKNYLNGRVKLEGGVPGNSANDYQGQ